MPPNPLSIDRISAARETLTAAAFDRSFSGAVDQDDPMGVFIEAKRNLAAYVQHKHGDQAWRQMLDDDV